MPGTLYVVATPIGNLEDITLRAISVLKEVDLIAAEDTRHTLKLLNHYDISKPLTSYFEHNKNNKGKYIINELLEGKNVALVSDAGSPGISDPGEDLIKEAIENQIEITSIPGPSAVINGLILSGISTKKFLFEGFLSKSKSKRKEELEALKYEKRTVVLYESPHSLLKTLKDILSILGNRNISIAREMTKKFEEIVRITVNEAIEKYSNDTPKGEFVLIIEGSDEQEPEKEQEWTNMSIPEHIDYYINKNYEKKEAIKRVAKDRGVSKREVYNIDVKLKNT